MSQSSKKQLVFFNQSLQPRFYSIWPPGRTLDMGCYFNISVNMYQGVYPERESDFFHATLSFVNVCQKNGLHQLVQENGENLCFIRVELLDI